MQGTRFDLQFRFFKNAAPLSASSTLIFDASPGIVKQCVSVAQTMGVPGGIAENRVPSRRPAWGFPDSLAGLRRAFGWSIWKAGAGAFWSLPQGTSACSTPVQSTHTSEEGRARSRNATRSVRAWAFATAWLLPIGLFAAEASDAETPTVKLEIYPAKVRLCGPEACSGWSSWASTPRELSAT